MVAIISIKVHDSSSGKKFVPVVLLVVAVDSDVLLQSLVHLFRLSVSLWVVSRSEMKLHVDCNSKGLEEV